MAEFLVEIEWPPTMTEEERAALLEAWMNIQVRPLAEYHLMREP